MNQGHRDWDLIIIDDGFSDRTFELAMELSQNDDRINVQKNSKNHGVTYSRNRGIKVAKGPWVAFLDSDDMWRREKLSSQLELAHASDGASFLFTGTAYMNEAGDISSYALRPPETVCFRDLLAQNPITCSSVLIRKDLLKDDAAHMTACMKTMPCGSLFSKANNVPMQFRNLLPCIGWLLVQSHQIRCRLPG